MITIKGPCFSNLDSKIICEFEHGQIAQAIYGHPSRTIGETTGSNSALCPLPLFARLGPSILNISDDDGATFKFYVVLNIGKNLYYDRVLVNNAINCSLCVMVRIGG